MIDVQHQINAVDRTVGSRTLAAGEARVITITQTYSADVADIWDACTNPERLPRWFLPVSGDLHEGGHYQLEGNAGGTINTCDPPHGFSATWEIAGEVSWIDVRMLGEGDGRTTLVLEHVAHVDDTRWTEFGPGAVGVGWDMVLMGLATHLAEGAAIDPAEAAAWTTSDDGRWFMVRSSDLWYDASVAAGADPQAAREAADRTTAAYTGAAPESGSEVTT
jgi:uncharacterized protein YndB with AHSA1/START domain